MTEHLTAAELESQLRQNIIGMTNYYFIGIHLMDRLTNPDVVGKAEKLYKSPLHIKNGTQYLEYKLSYRVAPAQIGREDRGVVANLEVHCEGISEEAKKHRLAPFIQTTSELRVKYTAALRSLYKGLSERLETMESKMESKIEQMVDLDLFRELERSILGMFQP